jgi:hypothetical protein
MRCFLIKDKSFINKYGDLYQATESAWLPRIPGAGQITGAGPWHKTLIRRNFPFTAVVS